MSKALEETLKFLQSASNAVAGNVSGPVDLISAALTKLGVNMPTPVGGSEWMRQKGLTADVSQGASQVAGETFGLLAPTMAVAKAPQIAKGLLQMGDNLAAPRTLNPQTGAINVKALEESFPEVDFSLLQNNGKATLSKVVVPKAERGKGKGSEFMKALTEAADNDASVLALTPSGDFGGSKSRLVEFYKRFGFVPNKGRAKDFEIMEAMYRVPQK
jgi:GNAT superfamily N-acetyltransferase